MGGTELAKPQVAIAADRVWLEYRVPVDSERGTRRFLPRKKRTVSAVRGISLIANVGEAVGLVGLNGSGKSSLLRMLAGVEPPTSGTVLASATPRLLGVGAALIPALSGQENITLGALAMGLTPEETEEARESIEKLAGLGDRIRLPMNTYSSGMGARLRFAISMAAKPEILMIDEALSTGDASFLRRTQTAMEEMLDGSGTVFLVSHAPKAIESICSRAIWIDEGRIVADGRPDGVMGRFASYARFTSIGDEEGAARAMGKARKEFPSDFDQEGNVLK